MNACSCGEDPPPGPQCTKDEECREGEKCSQEGQCIAGAECVRNEDCFIKDPRFLCNTERFVCEFRPGFGDECGVGRPCPFGLFCSSLHGVCYNAAESRDCTRRSQCPANQICDREANKCIPDLGCFGDSFCENGEICDFVNHTCRALTIECISCILTNSCEEGRLCYLETMECLGGGETEACSPGEKCDPLGRCVQCTNSDECGPGLFCNVSVGRCESNIQCADDPSLCPDSSDVTCIMCTPPEICDNRTKRCQAPPTECENDTNCTNDQFCNLALEIPICQPRIPDCLNDLLDEPRNDIIANARELPESEGPDFDELKICPGDLDWYRIDVVAGTYLTIDARFKHLEGDIELQLFLPDGRTLVDESRSTTDNERVLLEVGTDLTLYLRVFWAIPAVSATPYRLIVARDAGEICGDDPNEPDDERANARPLVSDVPYEGRVCPADPDWFVLNNVPGGSTVELTLDFIDNLGDLDLEVYRADSSTPLLLAGSFDDDEHLIFDASYRGDYYVRVFGKQADSNVYTIRADIRTGTGPGCLDDPLEPNDHPTTATTTFESGDLSICAGDEDWFAIHLEQGEAVFATIGFDAQADLELKFYEGHVTDPFAAPLFESVGTTPREFITFRSPQPDDYLVRVHGVRAQDVSPYSLYVSTSTPQPCRRDFVDQQGLGETQADAYDLGFPPMYQGDLSSCPIGDEDWYRIWIEGGFQNVLRLQYLESDARLDMEIWDAFGGTMLWTSVASQTVNYKEVNINVPGSGYGLVEAKVFRTSGFESDYSLSLDLMPMIACSPDIAEPNDEEGEASLVASSSTAIPITLVDLSLCATQSSVTTGRGDEDFFVLHPPAVGAVIQASIAHANGDLSLELISPGPGVRACFNFSADRCYSDGLGLTEHVTFTATTTEPYYLKVSSIYSDPNVQIKPPDSDTQYDLVVDYTQ